MFPDATKLPGTNHSRPTLLGRVLSPSPMNWSAETLPCVCAWTDGVNERPAVTREHRCGLKKRTNGEARHVSFDLEKNRVFTVQPESSDTL